MKGKCETCGDTHIVVQACPSCCEEPLRIEPLAVVKAHVSEYLGPNYHLDCHFEGPAGLGEGHTWPKWFPVRAIILPREEEPDVSDTA